MDLYSACSFMRCKIRSQLKPALARRGRSFLTQGLRHAALAILLVLQGLTAHAYAQSTPASLTKAERVRIEAMLTDEVQRTVNAQKRIEGQGKHVTATVRLDPHTAMVVVNLSKSYVPRFYGGQLEDLLHDLALVASDLLRDVIRIQGVEFRYEGKDIYHYFPEERPENYLSKPPTKGVTASTSARTIVVAAGHGLYYHYGYKDWRAQRDPYNGIIEDFITPEYANELKTWLIARSEAVEAIAFPRSRDTTMHAASSQPWWKVAARYYLQELYPQNREIWYKLRSRTDAERERKDDINSRPLFANHIGASTLIHLHTNGADSTSATGTRVLYHAGRVADQALGNSILCYMKEMIHAKTPYENYTIPSHADGVTDNGENMLASMPSVVIESGFHTNPSDAAALQDPVFRTAAMKGVEKGYRLNAAGKPCQPFKIASIAAASGNHGTAVPVKVHYQGFPQFPVTARLEITSCPGNTCSGSDDVISADTPSPLTWIFRCNSSPSSPTKTIGVRTTLIDDDGVTTNPVESTVTCMQASGTSGDDAAADTAASVSDASRAFSG